MTYSRKAKLEKHKAAKVCKICKRDCCYHLSSSLQASHTLVAMPYLLWYPVSLQTKSENKPFFLPFFSGKNS